MGVSRRMPSKTIEFFLRGKLATYGTFNILNEMFGFFTLGFGLPKVIGRLLHLGLLLL